jgi:hypothetical protein
MPYPDASASSATEDAHLPRSAASSAQPRTPPRTPTNERPAEPVLLNTIPTSFAFPADASPTRAAQAVPGGLQSATADDHARPTRAPFPRLSRGIPRPLAPASAPVFGDHATHGAAAHWAWATGPLASAQFAPDVKLDGVRQGAKVSDRMSFDFARPENARTQ